MPPAWNGWTPAPAWRGTIRYNLACHYALRGESAKAIATLAQALHSNPDLTEWSQQDSDLDLSARGPGVSSAVRMAVNSGEW